MHPRAQRPRRFPFTRLGLTLVVGSVIASLFHYYTAWGVALGDITKDDHPPIEPRPILDHFLNHFLFAGTIPTALFWAGIALMALGAAQSFIPPRRRWD